MIENIKDKPETFDPFIYAEADKKGHFKMVGSKSVEEVWEFLERNTPRPMLDRFEWIGPAVFREKCLLSMNHMEFACYASIGNSEGYTVTLLSLVMTDGIQGGWSKAYPVVVGKTFDGLSFASEVAGHFTLILNRW